MNRIVIINNIYYLDSQSNKLHYMSGYSDDNNNIINIINY